MITLSMLTEYLKDYKLTDVKIAEDVSISSVRISEDLPEPKESTLYLLRGEKADKTHCISFDGSSFIIKADLFTAFNKVLEAIEFYDAWTAKLQDACRKGCTLTELLDLSAAVLPFPMMILDSNEWMIAHTTSAAGNEADNSWVYMLEHNSMPASVIAEYNKQFYKFFQKRTVYRIPGDFFAKPGYAFNLFFENYFCGVIVIVDYDGTITPGMVCAFTILSRIIEDMIASSTSNMSLEVPGQPLNDYLTLGDSDTLKKLTHSMELSLWKDSDSKVIIFAAPSALSNLAPNPIHSRIIFAKTDGLMVSHYLHGLVLLCNRRILENDSGFNQVLSWLSQISYGVGISNDFFEITDIPVMFHQAYVALTDGINEAGAVNHFKDHVMTYLIDLIKKEDENVLAHPLLNALSNYDAHHGSRLYETLFVFLKNERRLSETAAELNIHRSTLIHRLERIKELLTVSLDDFETRTHLLLAYCSSVSGDGSH